jgi:hypothetical protein
VETGTAAFTEALLAQLPGLAFPSSSSRAGTFWFGATANAAREDRVSPKLIDERLVPIASANTKALIPERRAIASFFPRGTLFAGLVVVGFANGLGEAMSQAVAKAGLAAALMSTFDISIIVWSAWALCIAFLLHSPIQPMSRSDGVVAAFALLAIVVPVAPLSWLALTGLAIHILRTAPRASLLHRGGWILLALTVPMFWARLLFAALSDVILQADAVLVGWLTGTHRVGNAIEFADGSGYLWIAPACSSLSNMSLAILCWVTATKFVNHPSSVRDIGWIALTLAAVIAINATRIALIGLYPAHFDLIHGPVGATVANWMTLGASVAICLLAIRHDRPARAYSGRALIIQPKLGGGLFLVLAVSLFLKLSGLTYPAPAIDQVPPIFPGEVTNLLEQQGFLVAHETPDKDLPWVVGARGDCKVRVTEVAPQGWQQGLLGALAGNRQLTYLFGGAIYSYHPTMRTLAEYYWAKLNRYIGRGIPSRSVLAVISTSACEKLPLRELANMPER